jgi:hypothetical protein
MTNDQLNQIKSEVEILSNNITELIVNMNNVAEKMSAIDDATQPEEFKEAAILYSQSKNQLTTYLLTAVDSLGITLLDVIEYVQSSPKAKLWVPEGSR